MKNLRTIPLLCGLVTLAFTKHHHHASKSDDLEVLPLVPRKFSGFSYY